MPEQLHSALAPGLADEERRRQRRDGQEAEDVQEDLVRK